MARGVDHLQLMVSRGKPFPVARGAPRYRELRVFAVPWPLDEACRRVRRRERRRPAGVIAMAVCHEDAVEAGAPQDELGGEFGQVLRLTDAGIDERRGSVRAGDEIRVVTRTGH